jgi:hypothetical protein
VPYILEKEEREREIEGGVELVFDGTMDGTHRVKRNYMLKILTYDIFSLGKPLWCRILCHIITHEN